MTSFLQSIIKYIYSRCRVDDVLNLIILKLVNLFMKYLEILFVIQVINISRAGSYASDFQTESVMALNKKLKVNWFQF